MRIAPTFNVAYRALRRNKMRSVLTALGIIIGVGAVIAMVGIGNGAKAQVESQIASLGENVILIFSGSTTSSGIRTGWGSAGTLKIDDAEAIRREVPGVIAAGAPPTLHIPQPANGTLIVETALNNKAYQNTQTAIVIDPSMAEREIMTALRDEGLGSLPGGGAEVFADRVRRCAVARNAWVRNPVEIEYGGRHIGGEVRLLADSVRSVPVDRDRPWIRGRLAFRAREERCLGKLAYRR